MIVVIDGPAGSGKSSTAKEVANRCGLEYIDSGALYRTCSVLYLKYGENKNNKSDNENASFRKYLESFNITFKYEKETFYVFLDKHDITNSLRKVEVAECVSSVAAMPEVREFVNNLMNESAQHKNLIADGRDLGTHVFPNADLKFYMIADLDTRAERRYEELKGMEGNISLEEIKENIKKRDLSDSTRTVSPLRKADEAIEIDTTNLTFNEQVQLICNNVRPHFTQL